jgi:hypothetical protein
MHQRLIDGALALYPRAIRERYGEEIADLLAKSPTPVRDLADVAWCALNDRITRQTETMTMAHARTGALTLVKLLLAPLGFAIALLTLMVMTGPVLNMVVDLGIDVERAAPVAYSLLVVPVGLLAWWLGLRLGRSGTVPAACAAVPAALALGVLALASVPGAGQALGETLNSSVLATLCWCAGIATLGLLLRALIERGRAAAAWFTGAAGGLVLLSLSTIAYVLSAMDAVRAPREYAPYWYLSAISGIDPGLVDNAHLQLSDAVKLLPSVLTVCTVFGFALLSTVTANRPRSY